MATRAAKKAEETRTVDPTTGAEKGVKLARYDLIPARFLWELAEHYGKGSIKYADRNWEKGYDWGKSIGALERHLGAFKAGQNFDPETASMEMIAVAWHAAALFTFFYTHPEKDDRSTDAGLPQTLVDNADYWAQFQPDDA